MTAIEQNVVSAVQAGVKCNGILDTGGPTHRAVVIKYAPGGVPANDAKMITDLTNIEVIRDGHTIWEVSAAELIAFNAYYGLPRADGLLPIHFGRPEMLSRMEEDNYAFGTLDVEKARIEVQIDAGAIAPEMSFWSIPIAGVEANHGQMLEVTSRPLQNISGAKSEVHTDLVDLENGTFVKALHFNTALITDYEIQIRNRGKKGIYTEGEIALHELDHEMMSHKMGGYTKQAGYTHIQLAGERHDRIFPLNVGEFKLTNTYSGAVTGLSVLREIVTGSPLHNIA